MIKVSVLLADGFEEIEALTAVDLLRRARIYVDTISITDDYTVHGAHGINVQTEDLFDEVDFSESDMIVLPGGMPGTTNLKEHAGVRKVVKEHTQAGKYVGAICAAPTVLADLGNIVTGRGAGTAVEFALKLIEVLEGEEKAQEVAKTIVCQ